MNNKARLIVGLLVGFAVAFAISGVAFALMRTFWPEYVLAVPHKTYTLAMLFSRLTVGLMSVAAGGCVATIVTADNGRATLWLGAVALVGSLPIHLYYEWKDYPAWYHFAYLGYLVPGAVASGWVWRSFADLRNTAAKPIA